MVFSGGSHVRSVMVGEGISRSDRKSEYRCWDEVSRSSWLAVILDSMTISLHYTAEGCYYKIPS